MEHVRKPARYDAVAITLHWLIGIAIIVAGTAELLRGELFPKGHAVRVFLGAIHPGLGTVIFALILLRLLWRVTHPAPALPDDMKGWEVLTAKITHLALYAAMIAVPVFGILTQFARGKGIDLGLLQIAPPAVLAGLGRETARALKEVHEFLGQAILALAFLHAVAAIWHHHVRKDDILTRMLPVRT